MKLSVNQEIFAKWPEVKIGVLVLTGIKNGNSSEILVTLRNEEVKGKKELEGKDFNLMPEVAVWKEVYRAFGSNPREYRSSVEALLRRVRSGSQLPSINSLVDLYNYLSIKHHVPAGAEDLDKVQGDIELSFAKGTETGKYIGDDEVDTCYEGEVIYKDNVGFICRRWNWREADRTKIEESTQNAVLVFEAMPPAQLNAVLDEAKSLINKYLAGNQQEFILSKDNPTLETDFKTGSKTKEKKSNESDQIRIPEFTFEHQKLGIKNSQYAVIRNVNIEASNQELEILKKEILNKVITLNEDVVNNNETTVGYKELLKIYNKDNLNPAGQNLVKLIRERKKFPTINTAVDSYNIKAAESFLAFGAHDLNKVKGNITFDYAKTGEKIPAVNMKDEFLVDEGDYVYRDEEKILAWLDVKDTDLAKINTKTKNILLMVEGTHKTTHEYIHKYLKGACELIIKYCGGEYKIYELISGKIIDENIRKLKVKEQLKVEKKRELPPKELISYQIIHDIYKVIKNIYPDVNIKPEDIHVEHPVEETFGDYSTNIAMRLTKELKISPLDIANEIAKNLRADYVQKTEAVKPGFINLILKADYLINQLNNVLNTKEHFGYLNWGKGQKWLIEHTSANPNKAMHLGHLRNNTTGMAIANIWEFSGIDVIRDCIDNNRGIAIAKLMWGYLKFARIDKQVIVDINYWFENQTEWQTPKDRGVRPDRFVDELYTLASEDFEKNKEVEQKVRQLVVDWENGDERNWVLWKKILSYSYEGQDMTMQRLGNKWDKVWHEHEHYKMGKEMVEKGLKLGIFKKEAGAIISDLSRYDLPDTVIIKSDGTALYITQDLALTKLKKETFNSDKIFWVIGPEQSLALKQMFAVCEQLGVGKVSDYNHIAFGYMSIKGKGKMSSRLGNVVYIDDLLDEAKNKIRNIMTNAQYGKMLQGNEKDIDLVAEKLAVGAVKYSILKVGRMQDIAFDFEESLSFDGNSGPYLQYTYARCKSVLNKSIKGTKYQGIKGTKFEPEELAILRTLYKFPEIVLAAAQNYAPNLICNYLFDLAQKFNNFYDKLPILKADEKSREVRLKITQASAQVIKNGLKLLGIESPERM